MKVSKRLQTFVKDERWEYKFPLTEAVRLYEDLGIYGDDAVEFLIKFSKEFNVNVSNFMAADYFKGDGVDFIMPIINLFSKRKAQSVKKTLTLGHLEKAIMAGKLNEAVISS